MRVLTTAAALAAMRDFWLSDARLTIDEERRVRLAFRKLLVDSVRVFRSANSKQQNQWRKLRRFYLQSTFGSALSTSWRRTRTALFLREWQLFSRSNIKNGRMQILDALEYLDVLKPILEALQGEDDEFFADLAIAIKFQKVQSRVNVFLAEYSLLMAGKPPTLTFGELQKIVGSKRRTLRKKIKELREKYGDWAVPLMSGRGGRPKTASNKN
jgi:Fic family protein